MQEAEHSDLDMEPLDMSNFFNQLDSLMNTKPNEKRKRFPARHYFSRKLKWGPIRFQQRKMTWRVCLRRPAFVPLQPKTQNIGFRLASYFDLARMT